MSIYYDPPCSGLDSSWGIIVRIHERKTGRENRQRERKEMYEGGNKQIEDNH